MSFRRPATRCPLPALLVLLSCLFPAQGTYAQSRIPPVLPFPNRVHSSVSAGRAAILTHPGNLVTVGQTGCEFRTLGEALARPPDGRTGICLMDVVHRESGIRITGTVEIFGFGADSTVLEAAGRPDDAVDRVIKVMPESRLYLSGLTIRGGRAQDRLRNGGGIENHGSLVVEDCAIVENMASAGAGVWSSGLLEMRRSLVAANRTVMRPAAEYSAAVGCNGSGSGVKVDKPGKALFEDCLFAWNSAMKAGGGLHVSCGVESILRNCTIYGNTAGTRGGGIDLAGGSLVLERCTVAANRASAHGMAIFNRGLLSISGSLIASEIGTAYYRAVNGGGELGTGILVRNEGNYCQSGDLPGSVTGNPGELSLRENGGPVWSVLPTAESPARGYGAFP